MRQCNQVYLWNRVSKTPDGRIVSKFFCKKAKSLLSLIVIKKGNFLLITLFGIKNIAEWFKTAKHKCARCPIQHFFQLTYWGIDIIKRRRFSSAPIIWFCGVSTHINGTSILIYVRTSTHEESWSSPFWVRNSAWSSPQLGLGGGR